jgi:hypothetical protein
MESDELVGVIPLASPNSTYFCELLGLDDEGELLVGAYPLTADALSDLSRRYRFPLPAVSDRPIMYTLEADLVA